MTSVDILDWVLVNNRALLPGQLRLNSGESVIFGVVVGRIVLWQAIVISLIDGIRLERIHNIEMSLRSIKTPRKITLKRWIIAKMGSGPSNVADRVERSCFII